MESLLAQKDPRSKSRTSEDLAICRGSFSHLNKYSSWNLLCAICLKECPPNTHKLLKRQDSQNLDRPSFWHHVCFWQPLQCSPSLTGGSAVRGRVSQCRRVHTQESLAVKEFTLLSKLPSGVARAVGVRGPFLGSEGTDMIWLLSLLCFSFFSQLPGLV